MNLIQQQNYLEYADKNDLVKMMQEPNPQFPSFLVLSEIQRRTINEKNFQAMQQRASLPKPSTRCSPRWRNARPKSAGRWLQ